MKDFFSKVTFGFLMAQVFPGAVAVLSLSFLYSNFGANQPNSLLGAIRTTIGGWAAASATAQLFLLGLCIGAGMAIHGIAWSVVGFYESSRDKAIFDSFWHKHRIAYQVLLGPLKIIGETAFFLFTATNIRGATVPENVPKIHKDLFPHFEFLQDFYLYNAQFFTHTAYALVGSFASVVAFIIGNGWTPRRIIVGILVYITCGLFFVLGRIQLSSLFAAEDDLVTASRWRSIGEA
jgi:hypothetical protein